MNDWLFEPLMYQVGWRSFGVDRPHYPFQCRPNTTDLPAYEAECATAAKQFQAQLNEDLYRAFVTMLNPQARVYGCGFAGPDDAEKVRVYAAVRDSDVIVVRQDPGPDHNCGGAVHVSLTSRDRCGEHVVGALPSVAAGAGRRIDVDRLDLEADRDDEDASASWLHSPVSRATPARDLERLLARPRTGVGRVEVYPGATTGERDTGGGREVRWVDIADDGRYLFIERGRTVSLAPGSGETFAAHVQELVTSAVEESRDARAS